MLKKTITYTDFNDVEQTEDFYFNLTKSELAEMEASVEGGMANTLRAIVNSQSVGELFTFFKRILKASVGIKSEDGKRFLKSEEISNDFVASPAYDILFMDLATGSEAAVEFVKGVIPKDLLPQVEAQMNNNPTLEAVPSQPTE